MPIYHLYQKIKIKIIIGIFIAKSKFEGKLLNEGDLKLDGLRLSMSTNVSGERAVLNKDQFIQLADVSVCLPKGVTYYINENN